jgi:hypothetical protein
MVVEYRIFSENRERDILIYSDAWRAGKVFEAWMEDAGVGDLNQDTQDEKGWSG